MTGLFERAHAANRGRIFGWFVKRVDHHTAEDLTQETFLRMWGMRDDVTDDDPRGVAPLLFKIARNLLVDHHRRASCRPVTAWDDSPLVGVPSGDDPAEQVVNRAECRDALLALPPAKRAAVWVSCALDLDATEAGRLLAVPAGTVKSRVFHARRALVGAR